MPAFLSEAWFGRARELIDGVLEPRPGLDGRLQFTAEGDGGTRRWVQVIDDGLVTRWESGELDGRDVEVRLTVDLALGVLRGEVDGTEALGSCTVVDDGGADPYVGPAPPIDVFTRPELGKMPLVPGASLVVQFIFWNGPFGNAAARYTFVDHRVEDMSFGWVDEPDITLEFPYRTQALIRRGDKNVLDALGEGRFTGKDGPLMVLGGLMEAPPWVRARKAVGPAIMALSALGEVAATDGYRAAMATLAGETTPAEGGP